MTAILGLMLDGDPPPEWRLFSWCIYFPALVGIVSWVLIRWRRILVLVALAIAVLAAYALVNQLHADIRIRSNWKTFLESRLKEAEAHARELSPEKRKDFEGIVEQRRHDVLSFDSQTVDAIPPVDRQMIRAVWFAALSPFVLIIALYLFAVDPSKSPKSLPQASLPLP